MPDRVREARERLTTAVARHAEAQGKARAADLARGRAEALTQKARARLAQMGAARLESAHRLAEELRAGPGTGPSLATNHDSDAKADAELKQTEVALDLLNKDHHAALEDVRIAAQTVHDAAQQVINLEAELIAAQLEAHNQRAYELRCQLMGLSYVAEGGADTFAPWPVPPTVLKALNWAEPQHAGELTPVKIAKTHWTRYRDRLVCDPVAVFDAPAPDGLVAPGKAITAG